MTALRIGNDLYRVYLANGGTLVVQAKTKGEALRLARD